MPVLGQSSIPHFPMPENILQDMEGVFHECPHRGFGLLDRFEGFFLRAFGHRFNLPASAWTCCSCPCSSSDVLVMSATLAAVTTTVCTSWLSRSAPMCAFIPKYHCWPLRVWCISGSRCFSLFLVEGGAAISVASAKVPSRSSRPRAVRSVLMAAKRPLHR